MKSIFIGLLSCLSIWPWIALSQTGELSSLVINGKSFAVTELMTSLPEFPPLKRRILSDTRTAVIPVPDSMGTLSVCFGRGLDSTVSYYVLHRRSDGITLSKLSIEQTESDTVRTTFDVRLLRDRQTPFPIEVRIIASERKFLFRWMLSPSNDVVPGGRPTPADVLVDVGKPFPQLTLMDLSGKTLSINFLRGKPTVINWWATWCTACVVEIPGLDSLVNIFGAQISFLAIAQNSSEEVLTFLKNRSFRFSHTLGNDSTIQALGGSVPRTIVLDTNGTVVLDLIGGSRDIYKQVEQAVNKIMRN